jgi:hypothetical protein
MLRCTVADAPPDDDWAAAEGSWSWAFIVELRRLLRRAKARLPVTLALAALLSGLVIYKVAKKAPVQIAHVVIAVTEGALPSNRDPIPVDQMQEYVASALMPHDKLIALVDEKNLFPLRKKLGDPFALDELADMVEVTVYRNYFLSDSFDPALRRTARIEIAATYPDGNVAFEVAEGVAKIILESSEHVQDTAAAALTAHATEILTQARADASALDHTIAVKELELQTAERLGQNGKAAGLRAILAQLDVEQRSNQAKLTQLETGVMLDRTEASAMAAGLDLKLEIVSERHPLPDLGRKQRLAIIAIIVVLVMVPVAGILVGAFDPRIHDTVDVTRLGFSSLGHLPGFAGDDIGSLRARGIRRRRAAHD